MKDRSPVVATIDRSKKSASGGTQKRQDKKNVKRELPAPIVATALALTTLLAMASGWAMINREPTRADAISTSMPTTVAQSFRAKVSHEPSH